MLIAGNELSFGAGTEVKFKPGHSSKLKKMRSTSSRSELGLIETACPMTNRKGVPPAVLGGSNHSIRTMPGNPSLAKYWLNLWFLF